ncbi:MAG: c-type cytochrome [Sulfurovum sp.]|nr:c-type cytochrome [Sulfurovum sp.]MCB4745973.1 c-type cytochrome [Sulfurovum sp.]MCB4748395.1 c-type cytochrome [Sulfurovum sp.]MCB4748788.1 c-type cytochrome [Sulfurovum sp.]MCB4751079.1 c-type cytochrome [Sulfurovum sp.]
MRNIYLPLMLASLLSYATDDPMKILYMKSGCSACHGLYAEGIGATPRLQGKPKDLLKERLQNLKKGKTRSAFGTVMVSFAQELSNKQIEQMTTWLSRLKKEKPNETYELEYFDNTGDGAS